MSVARPRLVYEPLIVASPQTCSHQQPQISFEARCRKNDTMDGLTESALRDNWSDARAVQRMLDAKGFWVCDLGLAADRKLSQKLKEEREVELAGGDDDDVDETDAAQTYVVERIVSHEKDRKSGEYIYVVKWKGYEATPGKEPYSEGSCRKSTGSHPDDKKKKKKKREKKTSKKDGGKSSSSSSSSEDESGDRKKKKQKK